ncbi:DUF188 domain-containing protein [Halobacillus salinarum]|uniref:UPF0178 protein MUN89_10835 n=1 Tax=Halobacillus salinarum TaxID=2932257 RepID=A0ABY4EFW1_9BACI|nr:DUF188 domain-containing protein [Halobacillus salinarum]UOQ42494.1 DUF188 domain-containing protein [Halobacillus salinarum]
MLKQRPDIWVDADSCPVKDEILETSSLFSITPLFITTINHFSGKAEGSWTFLDDGSQSVDLYIVNHVKPGDIVITQDLSLAVLLTSRRVYVITPRGKLINEEDADEIMFYKHLRQKTVKRKGKWKGPSSFTNEDREAFTQVFKKTLSSFEGI